MAVMFWLTISWLAADESTLVEILPVVPAT